MAVSYEPLGRRAALFSAFGPKLTYLRPTYVINSCENEAGSEKENTMRKGLLENHRPPCWIDPEGEDAVYLAHSEAGDERRSHASDLLESVLLALVRRRQNPHGPSDREPQCS